MRRIMPVVCSSVKAGICCFSRFWSGIRCSDRARKGGLRGAPKLAGRFLTPNTILSGKFPWFAMVLVAVGECFALRKASFVYR